MHMARLGAIYQQCERWENDKPRQRRTKSSAKPDESSLDLLKVRALDRSRVSLLTLVEVRSPVSSAVWEWCFLQIWVCFRKAPWHRKSWSEFQQILGPCQIIAGCLTLRCIQQLQSLAFPVLLSIQLIFEPIFFLLGFLNCWENSTSSELALHFCRGHDYFHVLLDSTATFDKICIDCEFVCVCVRVFVFLTPKAYVYIFATCMLPTQASLFIFLFHLISKLVPNLCIHNLAMCRFNFPCYHKLMWQKSPTFGFVRLGHVLALQLVDLGTCVICHCGSHLASTVAKLEFVGLNYCRSIWHEILHKEPIAKLAKSLQRLSILRPSHSVCCGSFGRAQLLLSSACTYCLSSLQMSNPQMLHPFQLA